MDEALIEALLRWQNPYTADPGPIVYHSNSSLSALELVNLYPNDPIKLAAAIERSIRVAYRLGKGEL